MILQDFKSKLANAGTVSWKPQYDLEQFWCFDVEAAPAALWPYISDTSRFNRELGFAPRLQNEIDGKIEITTNMVGFEQIWIEEPWTWVAGETINAERNYKKGMAENVHAVFHIAAESTDKSKVYIFFGWQAKNWFWRNFIKITEPLIKSKFAAALNKIESFLKLHRNDFSGRALTAKTKTFTERQQQRLYSLIEELKSKPLNSQIIDKLVQHITTADDFELESIRVIKLADEWGFSLNETLGVCLHATRTGLLNISWNVVCPHCRGPRFSAGTLGDIPTDATCNSCDIDFSSSEPDVIEVVFKVNNSVREVPQVMYCAAEPAKKSHIKIHQKIEPKKTFSFKVPSKVGYYRGRILGHPQGVRFQVVPNIEPVTLEIFSQKDFSQTSESDIVPIGPHSELTVNNLNSNEMVFSFEELQWSSYALQASQILSFSDFRDLFSNEHLKSNVRLHLGEQTILFTDIVGSTKFYETVGDAKAFAEVRSHFQDIFSEVKKNDGAIIKTIGDAVMAAFPSAVDAFKAAQDIQQKFSTERGGSVIRVRISMNKGPVMAVQLNTGVDYFGAVVNLGAKIQSLAGAGEVAMTTDLYDTLKLQFPEKISYPVAQRLHQREVTQPVPVTVIKIS